MGLTGPGASSQQEDEEEAMYYAKKLGLKGKRLQKALNSESLDGLLDDLEGGDDDDDLASSSKADDDIDGDDDDSSDGEGSDVDESDDVLGIPADADMTESESDESELDEENENEDVEIEEDENDDDQDNAPDLGDDFTDDGSGDDEEIEQSSALRPKVEKGSTINNQDLAEQPTGKYVPPHMREKPKNVSEQRLRLRRQMQGILNRLSDANMESIFNSLEEGYRNNSRHDMTDVVTEIITSFVSDHANLLDSFVNTYAALVACLYNIIGLEFGAALVQRAVEIFDEAFRREGEAACADAGDAANGAERETSKLMANLALFMATLYNFDVVGCPLVYDLVRACLDRMLEADVEVVLRILRVAGFKLRGDDPSALKDIVQIVHDRSAKGGPVFERSRVKFLVETIMNLKNNKKKPAGRSGAGHAGEEQSERLTKFVRGLARRRGLAARESLRMSLDDVRSVATKGRWWLVGAALAGRDEGDGADGEWRGERRPAEAAQAAAVPDEDTADLLQLAKAQRMNTEVRRSVFVVIMSSEDYIDAHERLLRLNLKEQQMREAVRVLLHCAGGEAVYNPYYALLAARLCDGSIANKVTFQYALWDMLRELGDGGDGAEEKRQLARLRNLARLYAHAILEGHLSLAILK
ncbi:suppressor of glycerol defect, partial [Cladochytrium tenue]